MEESTNQNDLINLINQLNSNEDVDGILVQLPLPKTINEEAVLNCIIPEKDADGFHPLNVGKLSISNKNDENLMIPCTPYGCLLLLRELGIDLTGKNAVVIGRSNIVGKPMAIGFPTILDLPITTAFLPVKSIPSSLRSSRQP